jgi:hypothetical protein
MDSQAEDIAQIRTVLHCAHTDQAPYLMQHTTERCEMLEDLSELLNTYPELKEEFSFETLILFHNARELHHEKVMLLTARYLPETYAAIREAQTMLKSTL